MPRSGNLSELWHGAQFILSEANITRARADIYLAPGALVEAGTVLGQVTATGFYAPLNPTATDGTEVAVNILYRTKHANLTLARHATVIGQAAEVKAAHMIFPTGITDSQKYQAAIQLANNNLFVDDVPIIRLVDADTLTADQVNAGVALGTYAGITAFHPTAVTYILTNNDGGNFSITAGGVINVAADISALGNTTRTITVQATLADTSVVQQTFTIEITTDNWLFSAGDAVLFANLDTVRAH